MGWKQRRGPLRDQRIAHNCAVLPCGQSRIGKADQARSRMQWRGALQDRRAAHNCAVLPCGRNRSGKADQVRLRSALMLPRSRHIRTALKCVTQRYGRSGAMCVTSLQGRQSLICVTLWIGRSGAMTKEKEDPAGLRELEAMAGAAPRSKGRAHDCAVLPCGWNRSGKADQVHLRSALMLPWNARGLP